MEANIIFRFAGRGGGSQRLALVDFAQLLDPKWTTSTVAEQIAVEKSETTFMSVLHEVAHSIYNFGLGGWLHDLSVLSMQ